MKQSMLALVAVVIFGLSGCCGNGNPENHQPTKQIMSQTTSAIETTPDKDNSAASTVVSGILLSLFFLAGFLNFSIMFFKSHKGLSLRLCIRGWLGWQKISFVEYQNLLRVLTISPDYSHKDGRLGGSTRYNEADWDSGRPVWDSFTPQFSSPIHYLQKPHPETVLYFYRTRRSQRGIHVELMKEGWTKNMGGDHIYPALVCFRNSGTLPQLPAM